MVNIKFNFHEMGGIQLILMKFYNRWSVYYEFKGTNLLLP